MNSHRILPAALLLSALAAACGDLPTRSEMDAQPAGPAAYDGGFTIGSGNSAALSGGFGMGSGNSGINTSDSGYTVGSGNGMAPEDSEEAMTTTDTAAGDSTGRSGYTMGSGN